VLALDQRADRGELARALPAVGVAAERHPDVEQARTGQVDREAARRVRSWSGSCYAWSAQHQDQQRGSILAEPRLLHLLVLRRVCPRLNSVVRDNGDREGESATRQNKRRG
jgi:hypothetical protein